MTKQFTAGMWRHTLPDCLCSSSKTHRCCHKSVYNKSVWRIPLRREGKQIKNWDCDHTDKMDLSEVFKHGAGLCDKRESWPALEFFFFFPSPKDRTRSDSRRQTFWAPQFRSPWSTQVLEGRKEGKKKKKKRCSESQGDDNHFMTVKHLLE